MTIEKRFWFVIDKGKLEYVQDNVTDEKITVSELEDLLNEMSETIVEQQSFIGRELLKFDKYLAERLIEKEEIIKEQQVTINKLKEENEKLRQILKDIVVATDETYTKNTSMFKVTVVLDYEKYREIRRCIE